MATKKISVEELRGIVKEAVQDWKAKKMSAAEKRKKTEKDKEKAEVKKESAGNIKITTEELKKMIQEAVKQKLSEEMEMPGETVPKVGDKVKLASGKMATVADIDTERQMVFITKDGVKMIGVPMDYVSVAASEPEETGLDATMPKDEGDEERLETIDKYLARPFLTAETRRKLEKEREMIMKKLGREEM